MFFITYDEKGLEITKEAKEFLTNLDDDIELGIININNNINIYILLGIISVVGKYRTGKSFFINWAFLNK